MADQPLNQPTPPAPAPPRSGGGTRRRILSVLLGVLGVLLIVLGAAAGWAWHYYRALCAGPCVNLDLLRQFQPNQASIVYDREGREIGRFFTEYRRVASLEEMPAYLPRAFLAIEDARFYRHHGVNFRRVLGAMLANLREGETVQGASTITMQLARNVYPTILPPRERTFERKIREIRAARAIEDEFPKDTILQDYLNTIYLGHGAYGVDAAARIYFGQPAGALSVGEAALLAGLAHAPSVGDPYRAPARARARRNTVLDRMHELGWLQDDEWQEARHEPIRLADESGEPFRADATVGPYFLEAVRRDLQLRLGPDLYRGGYHIHTTLDAPFQQQAERVLEQQMVRLESGPGVVPAPRRGTGPAARGLAATPYLQAGLAVFDPDSGDVLVLIGGRSFAESPFNRMTQAWRQPGSAFKPFVYATALELGMSPDDPISDEPIEVRMPAGNIWRPQNYNAKERNGTVTLESALARSLNRATVRLGMRLGPARVAATARAMGYVDTLVPRPAMLLGSEDVHPVDLIAAYAPLARGDGRSVRPRLIRVVEDAAGDSVVLRPAATAAGITPGTAQTLRGMLQQVVERGTAIAIRRHGYAGPVAGKTGTTNGTTNAWFIGMTPDYLAGVWVGFDQPRPILPDTSATGGRIAAPIWAEIMKIAPHRREQWPGPAVDSPGSDSPADRAVP